MAKVSSHLSGCTNDAVICAALLSLFLPLFAFLLGWYEKVASPFAEFKRQYSIATLMAALLFGFTFFFEPEPFVHALLVLIVSFGATLFLLPLFSSHVRLLLANSSWWLSDVVVFNEQSVDSSLCKAFCDYLEKHPEYGLRFRTRIEFSEDPRSQHDLFSSVKTQYPNALAVLLTDSGKRKEGGIPGIKKIFSHVILVPLERDFQASFFESIDLGLAKCLVLTQNLWNPRYIAWKRCMDLVICALLSVVLLPLVLCIAVAIRLESPGPILYRQNRVGQFGKTIRIFKFRTMVANADALLPSILAQDAALREEWEQDHKLRNDPRVTSVGAILRKLSLDEIPQVLNILLGEMSLVGPRPIVAEEKAKYGAVFEEYCMVRPGLTGLWQVSGRNNTRYEERVAYDHLYINTWSPSMDLWILARTVPVVLSCVGAY